MTQNSWLCIMAMDITKEKKISEEAGKILLINLYVKILTW